MIDYEKIRPIKDKVLVRLNELQDVVLPNGLVIPKDIQQKTNNGIVVAVGSIVKSCKVGDHICFVDIIDRLDGNYTLTHDFAVIGKWREN